MKSTYADFMRMVEAYLVQSCGLCTSELPDWSYIQDYTAGKSARQTADRALQYAGFIS